MNLLEKLRLQQSKPKKETSPKANREPALTQKQKALKNFYKDEDKNLFI
ncbi:hypothetical protein [Hanstruepera neustonica]|nr:hypothetical protein [Hanstruepera neustonica]